MDIKAKEVVSTLMVNAGVGNQKANVKFMLDRSVSTKALYDNGFIQKVSERILPIGLALDNNKQIEMFIFEDRATKIGTAVTESNYSGFVDRMVSDLDYGGTKYSAAIEAILRDTGCAQSKQITYLKKDTGFKSLFGNKPKEVKAKIMVDSTGRNELPTICFVLTDGDCDHDDIENTKRIMFESAPIYPVFFQFIGVKSASTSYKLLSKLDTMGEGLFDTTERFIDNANFQELTAEDLLTKSNEELYKMLLGEFLNEYLPAAKNQFLIK